MSGTAREHMRVMFVGVQGNARALVTLALPIIAQSILSAQAQEAAFSRRHSHGDRTESLVRVCRVCVSNWVVSFV